MPKVTNADLIRGLRTIADMIEQNPDVEFATGDDEEVMFNFRTWYIRQPNDVRRQRLADVLRAIGSAEKSWLEEWLHITKVVAPGVTIQLSSQRETVCERVVVGKMVIPAKPEQLLPAEPEHEIEQVEWRCQSILAAMPAQMAEAEAKLEA